MIRFQHISQIALIAVCGTACAQTPIESQFSYDEERSYVERVYHYERSNSDGTRLEYISTFRASETDVEVFKRTARCTQAALVTAELDLSTLATETVTGGQLLPDGSQFPFAFLERNPDDGQMSVRIELPQTTLEFETHTQNNHFMVYDFDLADLNMVLPYLTRPEDGFTTEMLLLWADPNDPGVRNLGNLTARFDGEDSHLGRDALRYSLTSDSFEEGVLWIDAEEGFVIETIIPAPNHPGYDDFKLTLTGIEHGEEGWRELLLNQNADCE